MEIIPTRETPSRKRTQPTLMPPHTARTSPVHMNVNLSLDKSVSGEAESIQNLTEITDEDADYFEFRDSRSWHPCSGTPMKKSGLKRHQV